MTLSEMLEMSDVEWAAFLRSLPREVSPEDVERRGCLHDREAGPYVPHEHRCYWEEARH